ncbi:MAG TPA: GNAT family N-acetyltransferase [Cyclobacteriaceae bacterium]|jgi:GNAT superfamily N-acetyltransferase|nr:GNAT family N-acetyltransferase [Cyclobacteriaceae bacterium]
MDLAIRKASEKDLGVLHEFEQGVVDAERPFDSTLREDLIHYYNLPELINSPTTQLLVAEVEGKIIACGYARIDQSKDYLVHSHHAYFGFMYVVPEMRGRGINKKIIEQLKIWAHSQEINEIRLEVYIKNSSAIRAYEKLGFQQHLLEMRMNLND